MKVTLARAVIPSEARDLLFGSNSFEPTPYRLANEVDNVYTLAA